MNTEETEFQALARVNAIDNIEQTFTKIRAHIVKCECNCWPSFVCDRCKARELLHELQNLVGVLCQK